MADKSVGKLTKKIGHQEYVVEWNNDRVLYIPTTKKEKAEMLKKFVFREVGNTWKLEDPRLVTLKREFLTELLTSITE